MASCAQDASFGPVSSCRSLDFTVYFDQTILSFTPDIIFFLLAIVRLIHLKAQPRQSLSARGNTLLALKCAASLFIIAWDAASLVYGQRHNVHSAVIWLAAPIFQIICAVLLSLLVVVEHLYDIAPSTLIIAYTFIRGFFTAAALRSAVKTGVSSTAIAISALVTSSYFLLFCVELIPKPQTKSLSNISTSSILSRSLYIWLFPLLWTGRNRSLNIDDCGSIPHEFSAQSTRELLDGSILNHWMIGYVSGPDPPSAKGWALVGGFVCVYGLIALMTSIYWEKVFDGTVRYRGGLVGSIYSKTLRLSSNSGKDLGGGVASTYMSVDVERVCQGLEVFHETWAALVSIVLAILLLYSQMSKATWPSFLPLAIMFALLVVAAYISRGVGVAQGLWLASTDKRVKYLTSVLHNYLPMKWSRYEDIVGHRAAQLSNNICITGALTVTAAMACNLSVLGPYAALAALGRSPLDPNRLFTIVATLSLMAEPIDLIGGYLPQLIAAYASLKRIEGYLSRKEKVSSLNEIHQAEKLGDHDISLETASFSWAPDTPPFLGPISMKMRQGELHICVGPVAAGKSMFLLSLLGETNCTQGALSVPRVPIAYAAQEPFIFSGTIRDNILFGHEYSASWYNRVLEACALTSDISRMEAQDGTFLAERGTNLSERMTNSIDQSIARAVALDAPTANHVNHLGNADNVFVFDSGKIPYHGTLAQIKEAGYKMDHYVPKSHENEEFVLDANQSNVESGQYEDMKASEEMAIQDTSAGFTPYFFYMHVAGWRNSVVVVVYLQQWSQNGGKNTGSWVGGYAGLTLGNFLLIAFGMWAFAIVITRRVGQKMHADELSGLLKTAPDYIMANTAGSIINRFSQDIFMCDLEFPVALLNVILFSVTIGLLTSVLAGSVVFILIPTALNVFELKAPWITLAIPFVGAIYWMVLSFYLSTKENVQTIPTLKRSEQISIVHIIFDNAVWSCNNPADVSSTVLASLVVGLQKSINPATIHEIATLPGEKDSASESPEKTLATGLREAASLTFRSVHIRYRADLPEAISNVSFHVSAGQKIGICGRSGSGKSSLILAIFRGLDQSLITGQILNSLLRENNSLVAQRPVIWYASVRENLDPHGIHTGQEIWSALDRIGLGSAIADLPDQLETILEDEGSLSTGQRQLLCLAQVLLRKRKFIILDEASSSVSVMQAHLLKETIVDFDMILVMENGMLVESGPPAELLSSPDSKFARLVMSRGIGASEAPA
ncbi:P-loop containing nucleoside triphosphate hydrolase protein [Mycena latifolia]|nr:P-loop containing nucleoside triphosphate hydrolase protein [Mycena latifolia]